MRRRSLFRDLLTVLSGTAGAQIIGLLVLPFLSRTFAPEAFGAFQLYMALLVFLTIGVSFRIEIALLSKREEEIERHLRQLLGLSVIVSVAVTIALFLVDTFLRPLGFPVFLLGLGLIGNALTQIVTYRLIRGQRFGRIATLKFVQVLVYAATAVAIAWMAPVWWGIIVADAGGRLAAAAVALVWIQAESRSDESLFVFRDAVGFVRSHWELPVVVLPGALANSAGAILTPILIFNVFGAAAAGQYGLVDRAMGVPVAMLVTAGSQVFSGQLIAHIQAGEHDHAWRLYWRVVAGGLMLALAGAAVGYALLPSVFTFVFGEGWDQARAIAQVMIFAYAVVLVSGLVNQTLVALAAYRLQSAWDFCWPLTFGAAWFAVVTLDLDLLTAVQFHALGVGGLCVVFLGLSAMRLRAAASSTPGSERI